MPNWGWEALAIASTSIHVLGYASYIAFVRRGAIKANPLSWLMFAYGTALLTFLEYQSGASWRELLLPAACSLSSIVVAMLCVRLTRIQEVTASDVSAFAVDVILTIAYVALWMAQGRGLSGALAEVGVIALLVCANATTLVSFVPILRSTFAEPDNERVTPWLLWTLAYVLLLAVTLRDASLTSRLTLLLYPALNSCLHFTVTVLAASRWWRPERRIAFEVRETGSTGLGMFTPRSFQRGERVFILAGRVRRFHSRSAADANQNPNWIGIGKDTWVDPEAPFLFLNHSCEPNLGVRGERDFIALRDIAAGEEITVDYSITEIDMNWSMACHCGKPSCRRRIGAIDTLPYDVFLSYLPYVGGYFRRTYLHQRKRANSRNKARGAFEPNPSEHTVILPEAPQPLRRDS